MNKSVLSIFIVFFALPVHAAENVVARVNGVAISAQQLESAVSRQIAGSTYHGTVSDDKRNEFRQQALEGLILRELQYQDAVSRGFKPDKKLAKSRMKAVKNKFNSEEEFKKALSVAGITEEDVRSGIERSLIVEDAIKKTVVEASRWNDADLKAYYDSNADKFKQPESVKLRIISIESEKKAADALSLLRSGEAFGTVAAKMSEDTYRTAGGDIGYVHRGRIYPELEAEAFKLKPGEMSGLIRAEGKWFIIKVEDKKIEQQISFEESKDKLKKELETRRSAELLEKWSNGLKAKAKIEILLNE